MNKNIKSFIPSETKPFTANYNCPISDQINVKQYNVIIDADIENNQVYLNLGYDKNKQYDCSFFLNSEDAYKLANALSRYASITKDKYTLLEYSKHWTNTLITLLKNKTILNIEIKCIRLFTDDPEDSLFGTLVLEIQYITKYLSETEKAIILSENMRDKQENYFEKVEKILKEKYNIQNIFIDKDGFKCLIQSMEIKLNKWIKANKKKNPPKQKIESMIPNDLKDDLKNISNRVISKLNENK